MIAIIIIIVVLCLLAIIGFFIHKKCFKSQPGRAISMRNSLVNRNYFTKPSAHSSTNLPYRYNNASNQIYASTTVEIDDEAYDHQRILDEEARRKHEQIHKSWAQSHNSEDGGGNNGSFSSSMETRNLLEHEDNPTASASFDHSPDHEVDFQPAFQGVGAFPFPSTKGDSPQRDSSTGFDT